jgi:hypothetical protein
MKSKTKDKDIKYCVQYILSPELVDEDFVSEAGKRLLAERRGAIIRLLLRYDQPRYVNGVLMVAHTYLVDGSAKGHIIPADRLVARIGSLEIDEVSMKRVRILS